MDKKTSKFQYITPINSPKLTEELLEDLKHVARKLNKVKLTTKLYKEHGRYGCRTFITHFGSWNRAIQKIGLEVSGVIGYSDEKLFENLLNIWQKKGKQPVRNDMADSDISYHPYIRRFGTWTAALKECAKYANNNSVSVIKSKKEPAGRKRFQRNPSLRLRFQVLSRDKFKCVVCGASPANDPGIKLHVDHIIPYSKGGETEISNLRTLCQNCNLGKGNIAV